MIWSPLNVTTTKTGGKGRTLGKFWFMVRGLPWDRKIIKTIKEKKKLDKKDEEQPVEMQDKAHMVQEQLQEPVKGLP